MKLSKLLFLLMATIIGIVANAQTKTETLTNVKIMQLSKIGLQPSVIISKIRTSKTNFDVSTEGLIDLSDSGVDPAVINEMMKSDTHASNASSNDPETMHKPGIYYYNQSNLKRVDPTVTSTNKSGGLGTSVAQSMTYGIAKNKERTNLAGNKSHLQINGENPTFYFYFKSDENANGDSWFFATATSPNEFVLVALTENKDNREMVIGASNAYGSSSGVPNKIKMPFDYTEVSEGIYKVTFTQPLKKGEYCFLYTSTTPSRYNNNKVFDFGTH